jgi:hypothetical protein
LYATAVPPADGREDGDDIQILEESPNGLIIQFQLPDLDIDTKTIKGQVYQQLSLQNCAYTNETGKARVPIRVVSLGIPDGSIPDISVMDAETSVQTGYRLYPVAGTDEANAVKQPVINYNFYRENRFYPHDIAEIQPVGFVRRQRLARLEIHPIQYNPATGQLKLYKKLKLKVSFSGVESLSTGSSIYSGRPSSISDKNFEDLYRSTLLNYQQAKNWRKPRSRSAVSMAPSRDSDIKYKLTVNKNGMYRLDYNYLSRMGIDPETIDPRKVEIRTSGDLVPIYVEGYDDGSFGPGDFIDFYGVKMNSIYTEENVYWLSWGGLGSPGSKSWIMATKNGDPYTKNLKQPLAFKTTEHWEDNRHYDPLKKVESETADHFFWKPMRGQDPKHNRTIVPIGLNLPYRTPGIGNLITLRVCFQGLTYARGASNHIVNIILNGERVDTARWEGQTEYISEVTLSQGQLHRNNWLNLECEDNNGTLERFSVDSTAPEWDLYINWIEIDYWRDLTAENNRLEFSTETAPPIQRTTRYVIDGFSNKDVEIFQIDESGAVAKIINPKVEKDGDTYKAIFQDTVDQPTRYFATTIGAMMKPLRIAKEQPSTLHDPANRYDYIMITHRDFLESTERLANFRRKQGLSVIVVDVDDIYDEFSYGIFDPIAIKRFLRYAYFNWDKEPTYVLLMGDAHWDYKYVYDEYYKRYKNYPRIYVPTYHAWGDPYGQTAMDHRFVTVSGDDILPDMFIGRIPAESAKEADDTVDKIIEYEDAPSRGNWQARIMMVSDDKGSKSGDEVFQESREELVEDYIPIGYEPVEVYLERIREPYIARNIINQEVNSTDKGVVIVEYAGHGGAHHWAHEGIFSWEDVVKLRNADRYPFVITTTCENGYFDNPMGGNKSIIELFTLQPRAGAIACLSATRLTFGQGNATFDKILYPKMFSENPPILGSIINAAKIEFINLGIATWTPSAEQYTLFGDPATKLALPELKIECAVKSSSIDTTQKLQLKSGSILRIKNDSPNAIQETEFNAQMQVSVIYPNNLDENRNNDIPIQKGSIKIWKGEFEEYQLAVPHNATSGQGRLRCYASDGNATAIGGVKFSVSEPVIEYYNAEIVNEESVQVHTAITDNRGLTGIKLVECVWHNTETWKWHTTPMTPGEAPANAPSVEGSWFRLQENIPLSRPGTSIEYKIRVVDTERNELVSSLGKIKVPIGVNLAISKPIPAQLPVISYSYSQIEKAWILSAQVENNGGKEVKEPVAAYFFEGNPDRNRDGMIDSDAVILAHTIIDYDQWQPGDNAIQTASVSVKLEDALYSGYHHIFVWINPKTSKLHELPGVDHVEDADLLDDKKSRVFPINEFAVGAGDGSTYSQSLDKVLSLTIPADAVDETIMSISSLTRPQSDSNQPDIIPAPIPQYGLDGGAFNIQLVSGVTQLRQDAQVEIKFDAQVLRDKAKLTKGLAGKTDSQLSQAEKEWLDIAWQKEAEMLGVYAWQEENGLWKYIPSHLVMDEKGEKFIQEPYVTLPINENRSENVVEIDNIVVDMVTAPIGDWAVFFLNKDRFLVYFRRQGLQIYERLKQGYVGRIYSVSDIGLKLDLRYGVDDFRYGDVYKFETYQDLDGTIKLQSLRSYNEGDGNVRISILQDSSLQKIHHATGEWAVFFTDPKHYEIHNDTGQVIRNEVGFPIIGEVGKSLVIPSIGVRIDVHEGRYPFQFGDKYLFQTLQTGIIRAQVRDLEVITLMRSSDHDAPSIQLWVGGYIPQNGTLIPPRPKISILLSDANGVDTESFSFTMSIDDKDFYPVQKEDYVFSERSASANTFTNIPVFYSPTLRIGKYRYRISIKDYAGNDSLVNNGDLAEFMFLVEENPDMEGPVISVTADGVPLVDHQIFHKSPVLTINIQDNTAIDESSVLFSFAQGEEDLVPLEQSQYITTITGDTNNPEGVVIQYSPHLMNGEYKLQVTAKDTSGNESNLTPPDARPTSFIVDEEVDVDGIMNYPNPFSESTIFTYTLTQPADKVIIKIYTLRGRLVRTLRRELPGWQYNEELWDGRDEDGNKLASGVYFYKFVVVEGDKRIEKIDKLAIIR